MLGKTLSTNKPLHLIWEEFLTHFKRKFCSSENMLELQNQLLKLKKEIMCVDKYINAFTNKMEFTLCVVPDELSKIDRYSKGQLWEYSVPVKQTPTFEAVI